MAVDNGFRFGSKEHMWPAGGEWVFVKGKHPAYEDIRGNDKRLRQVDDHLLALEAKMVRALDLVRFLRVLVLGGHIRKDKLAAVSELVNETMDPIQATQVVYGDMEKTVAETKKP